MNSNRRFSPEPSLKFNKSKSNLSRNNSFILTKQIQKNYLQQKNNPKYEKLRLNIKKFFNNTLLGQSYQNSLQILTILSVLQFILQTYVENSHQNLYQMLLEVELFIASLFAFDWFLGLFLHPRWDYISSFYSLVDICIIIPVYFCYFYFTTPVYFVDILTIQDAFNTFFHCGRSLLLVRILRLHKNILYIQDDIHRHLLQIALTILAILLFDTGILQYLETTSEGQSHPFHLWLYYMIMSVSTVGYDRLAPHTIPGKLVSITAVCFLLIYIPDQAQKVWEKMNRLSKYLRSRYSPSRTTQHIVICGDISSVNMREFISELFHEDHTSNLVLNAVILNPGDPSPEIYSLLIDPYYSLFLRYFNGSPLLSYDLHRVAIESSSAVFLLSNKFTLTPESEDAKLILQFASIRRYVSLYYNPMSPIDPPLYCIQLIQPESKSLVKLHDPDGGTELVICLSELKTSLMSMTAIFPGSCTLIFNLLTAYADDDSSSSYDPISLFSLFHHEDTSTSTAPEKKIESRHSTSSFKNIFKKWKVLSSYQVDDDGSDSDDSENQDGVVINTDDLHPSTHSASETTNTHQSRRGSQSSIPDWFQEYKLGYEWEIYLVQLGTGYRGQKFVNIVSSIYEELGVVLFAIRVKDVTGLTHASVMINPYQYTIPMSRNVIIEGFIIAKDKHSANVMSHIANSLSSPIDRNKGDTTSSNNKLQKSKISETYRRRENICITPGNQVKKNLRDILYPQSTPYSSSSSADNRGIEYEERLLNEEKIFHQLYYTTSSPNIGVDESFPTSTGTSTGMTMDHMLISTSLLLEYPLIKNHIILITKETGIKYLYNFIKPLRKKYLGQCIDIIILSPVHLNQEIFQTISIFQGIYWIIGSPLKVHDLRRAGIYRALQCVILADYHINDIGSSNQSNISSISTSSSSNSSSSSSTEEYSSLNYTLADAESIFIYHSIKKENPSLNILVEIIRSENVKFLESSMTMEYSQHLHTQHHHRQSSTSSSSSSHSKDFINNENYDYHLSSNFASGSLFMSSIVDSLVPQAFYNPHLIVIINKLLGNHDGTSSSSSSSSSIENPETSLVQILLPEEFDGKTYRELFTTLLYSKGILCIGLYRKKLQFPMNEDKYKKKSNPLMFSYVYTNPKPDEIVTKLDRVYVLSDKQLLKPHLFTSKDFIDTVTSVRKQSNLLQKLQSTSSSITPKLIRKSGSQVSQASPKIVEDNPTRSSFFNISEMDESKVGKDIHHHDYDQVERIPSEEKDGSG